MSYIGSTPTSQAFAPGTDTFSGTGSQVAFTLSRNVSTVNDILVVVNNVDQQPTAYSVLGSTLTFTAAPSSGTNNIYVRYLSTNLQTIAPQQGSVYPSSLSTGGPTWDTLGNINVANTFGYKNRIINGGMVIDQRLAGTSYTQTASNTYTLDRWCSYTTGSVAGKLTIQQNAGSVTPPAGFKNYLGITSTSAYSPAAGDIQTIGQAIEGLNVYDLGWGTASAATVTLSFWVRSSLTGTFGGSIINGSGFNYSYPFTYTISTANTWEQKSITIPGPTAGTWLTTNGVGLAVIFSVGTGATYKGTAGAWTATGYYGATGETNVTGTNGATWYVTGVQLEKGATATSFDYRDYGRELAMCQRYYQRITRTSASTADVTGAFATGAAWTNAYQATISLPVTMRSAPTIDSTASTTFQFHIGGVTNTALGSITFNQSAVDGVRVAGGWTYSSTNGLAGQIAAYNATAYIGFSSEL